MPILPCNPLMVEQKAIVKTLGFCSMQSRKIILAGRRVDQLRNGGKRFGEFETGS